MNASSRKREEPTGYLILPVWSPPSHHARIVPTAHPLEALPMQGMSRLASHYRTQSTPALPGTETSTPGRRGALPGSGSATKSPFFLPQCAISQGTPALMAEFQKKKKLDTHKNFCQFIIRKKGCGFPTSWVGVVRPDFILHSPSGQQLLLFLSAFAQKTETNEPGPL